MRIGMILDSSFPPDQRVEKEALSLIKEGHDVFLFCLNFKKLESIVNVKGIHVHRYPAGKLVYKLSALAYTFPFYRWLVQSLVKEFLIKNSIKILHIHDMVIAETAMNANRYLGLPVVLDLHENRPAIMRDYRHLNRFPGKWLIDLKKWQKKYYELARKADRVIVVTALAKDDIVSHADKIENEVIVVPNTINYEEFVAQPYDEHITSRMKGYFNLLYIGDTSLRRGTDTLIKVISKLKADIPNIRLWIVGLSSADNELIDLSKKLNIETLIEFEGWKDHNLLPTYIYNAQIALSPLKRNLHHDTTYANKLFQYMALGCPLIVSDCIVQAQLVESENCGLVYKADDIDDLLLKILDLYYSPLKAKKLGDNGNKSVELHWNWDKTVKPLINMYVDFNH